MRFLFCLNSSSMLVLCIKSRIKCSSPLMKATPHGWISPYYWVEQEDTQTFCDVYLEAGRNTSQIKDNESQLNLTTFCQQVNWLHKQR